MPGSIGSIQKIFTLENNAPFDNLPVYDKDMELDLYRLGLRPGEGWYDEQEIALESSDRVASSYTFTHITVSISVSKTATGYVVNLAGSVMLEGACTRCLEPARHQLLVESWEWDNVSGADDSRYLQDGKLALQKWAREISSSEAPMAIKCSEACQGLCGECGKNRNHQPHTHPVSSPAWSLLWDIG
jgi:uncharacterized metal-binding protein YceD (DUF177 family)